MIDGRYYAFLHSMMFAEGYPGYRPAVREIPNGDGKVDADKRFSHLATKYLTDDYRREHGIESICLMNMLIEAHYVALEIASVLEVPTAFLPHFDYGAARLLEYPVGAVSNLHTDFDLFTVMIYRDSPECFVARDQELYAYPEKEARLKAARKLNAQLHIGEIGELIGLGPATPHEVIANATPQHSMVYFAIPDHAAVLPSGQTVGEWLVERVGRSRTEAKS